MYAFARGENLRWMGQIMLSRIYAYRREHGFPSQTESLAALNRSLPPQARRTGATHAKQAVSCRQQHDPGEQRDDGDQRRHPFAHEEFPGVPQTHRDSGAAQAAGSQPAQGHQPDGHVQHIISSPKELVAGSYALYLRPFDEDPELARLHRVLRLGALARGFFTVGKPEERRIADTLTWAGLPLSVGRPGERAPYVGVPRVYLPFHGWQEPMREMMRGASVVVLVLGHGAGTQWEHGAARDGSPLDTSAAPRLRPKTGHHITNPGTHLLHPGIGGRLRASRTPPLLEKQLMGALDRSMWPAVVRLTDYELRTGKRHG